MRTQKGQALLIAVLLMTVILLVGGIFVAIVVYVQGQSARSGDARQSDAMTHSGIQHADRMLRHHTADWRPPEPPAWCAGSDNAFDSPEAIISISYSGDDEFDPGFWGADASVDTEDDYYTFEEIGRGWCPRRTGSALPPDPTRPVFSAPGAVPDGETLVRGFTRIPDPRRGTPAGQDFPSDVGNGHVLLRLTYDPDPPFEGTPDEDRNGDGVINSWDAHPLSHMIRIESIGVVIDEGFTWRRLIAYKPIAIGDYVRFITNKTGTGQAAYLGIPPIIDYNGDGLDGGAVERHITRFIGPFRANTHVTLIGREISNTDSSLDFALATDSGPGSVSGIPYLRRDAFECLSGVSYGERLSGEDQATVSITGPLGYNRLPIHPSQPQIVADLPFETYSQQTGDGAPAMTDGVNGPDNVGSPRYTAPLAAPILFDKDPATGRTVFEELTRYSGSAVALPAGYPVNSGELGHGSGVYIANFSDRQFLNNHGECDFDVLMDDWLRNISPTEARAEDSGWNALQTTYTPVGVEIYIAGFELPASTYTVAADPRTILDGTLWAPAHVPGEPQIVLRRHDEHWTTAAGADSGRYAMVIDHPSSERGTWPTTQVIMAAGKARVWGTLPARPAAPAAGTPGVTWPDYNLTIVSGGTIYIDGSILSPRDVGTDGGNDDRNTKLALLAQDCVCLNPTRIVPQEASALVSASPDDTNDPRPDASHWELTSEAGARITSSWVFGAPPATTVSLAAIASGDDPGPSAIAMSFQPAWTNPWTAYDFDPASPAVIDPFYFVPPGTAAGVNWSNSLTPNYQPVPDPAATPAVPWDITASISTVPGNQNNLAMYWANPAITAGATNPWVKKWKIVETDNAGAVVPAVHCRVNAVVYAETGCWFVIPGAYFMTPEEIDAAAGPSDIAGENINGLIDTVDEQARAEAYMRYNYDIIVNGSITENFTAPPDAVYEWTEKWAVSAQAPGGGVLSITYVFDSATRASRDRGGAGAASGTLAAPLVGRSTPSANLPRIPNLPVSPGLVYFGEAM